MSGGWLVALVLFAALALVLWWWRAERRRLAARIDELAAAVEFADRSPPALPEDTPGRILIAVEIHNPLELAENEVWISRYVSGLSPGLIRREVERRARQEIARRLPEYGVKASVWSLSDA